MWVRAGHFWLNLAHANWIALKSNERGTQLFATWAAGDAQSDPGVFALSKTDLGNLLALFPGLAG